MIDEIRYVKYSTHDDFIIVYDSFSKDFCIHSSDEDNDVGVIIGFSTAASAIDFAHNRIVNLEKDSRS